MSVHDDDGIREKPGADDTAVSAVNIRALFKENAELLGMESGAISDSVRKRGAALAKETARSSEAKAEKQRTSSNDIAFLDLLNQNLAPI